MSTISEKLTQLNTIKSDIKTAINNKGGEVGNDFSTYATAISNLSTGSGGSGDTHEHPDFYELRTRNGIDYSYLFYYSTIHGELDLSSWDTSNVVFCNNCFSGASNLTSLNLSGWDTSNITSFSMMLFYCTRLVTVIGYIDLSNARDGFYPNSWSAPLYSCSKLETLYLKNIYKKCTMTNDSKWCINLSPTKIKDECLISIISELPDLINDKGLAATDQIILTLPPSNTLTAEQVQVAIDKGWSVANTTY